MREVEQTRLPGVGLRLDVKTAAGALLGVIVHHGGDRDLLVFDREDPDRCAMTLRLDEEDARALAEMLGASSVTSSLLQARQEVAGLVVDWIRVGPQADVASINRRAVEDPDLTVVAVLHEGHPHPVGSAPLQLQPGDTLVVVGTAQAIDELSDAAEG